MVQQKAFLLRNESVPWNETCWVDDSMLRICNTSPLKNQRTDIILFIRQKIESLTSKAICYAYRNYKKHCETNYMNWKCTKQQVNECQPLRCCQFSIWMRDILFSGVVIPKTANIKCFVLLLMSKISFSVSVFLSHVVISNTSDCTMLHVLTGQS